ncbi:MAG: hypothetical protein A2073_01745 [Deltaproteobacteria bacterium GWC2_42_11]|nr:MAG: hypothetical protein A2073_01745 [Deltaproteobacteria bacterium GWC2_42_11]HBO84060.1 hypothetical protein [Deltaproteobacteria bacterium]
MAGKHHHKVEGEGIINGKMIVGEVVEANQKAEDVFKKHLGEYCLSIPGSRTESIEFLAAMHDCHEEPLLEELNRVCKKAPPKMGHF